MYYVCIYLPRTQATQFHWQVSIDWMPAGGLVVLLLLYMYLINKTNQLSK